MHYFVVATVINSESHYDADWTKHHSYAYVFVPCTTYFPTYFVQVNDKLLILTAYFLKVFFLTDGTLNHKNESRLSVTYQKQIYIIVCCAEKKIK